MEGWNLSPFFFLGIWTPSVFFAVQREALHLLLWWKLRHSISLSQAVLRPLRLP